jgi:hypothetical protein
MVIVDGFRLLLWGLVAAALEARESPGVSAG